MREPLKIATLADIYALPDADAMRRCLDELAIILPQARALNDLLNVAGQGPVAGFAGYAYWSDDGKGELAAVVKDDSGTEQMRMEIKREK